MFYINKNHVPPSCKIAKFCIVMSEIAHGSSHRCSVNKLIEKLRATMKDFL